ncbi:hypothetical protein P7B02_18485 [Caulobacter segnis]|uniref:hypothetical protein n=1 Tax=Caulobacter segnis TaxID=88688 RepID=UPI00240FF517|nr:hypothetical protein [Caulobacter segnis]MDG2523520.1 hypothetical protein [Caulobacter segnis]
MRALAAIAAVSVLAVASQASANDLVYKHLKGPEALAPYDGFALWQIQARCAGLMEGLTALETSRSRSTERSAAAAKYFHTESVKRYMIDRGVKAAQARDDLASYVALGRTTFEEAVADRGGVTGGRTPANMYLNECAAVGEHFSPPSGVPPKILLSDMSGQEIVCKKVEQVGSRMGKRVCKTREDMAEEERETKEIQRRMIELGGCRTGGQGCGPGI